MQYEMDRYRQSAKIEALRGCKDEILGAHRIGMSIHRIAQIFRQQSVDISAQHLMRAIRLFIAEEERSGGKSPGPRERHQGPAAAEESQKGSVKYQVSEQPFALVREAEFAKQLRLARYLAASSLPPARPLELASEARAPKDAGSLTKARPRTKKKTLMQKVGAVELAKERRRAAGGWEEVPSSGPRRSEKHRGFFGSLKPR